MKWTVDDVIADITERDATDRDYFNEMRAEMKRATDKDETNV